MARLASTPRTLLPRSSSGGLYRPMPNCDGLTATRPPDTPDLAGSPTRNSHSPEKSYIPHVAMTVSTCSATACSMAVTPVRGLTPPLASVAPMTARSAAVTSTEHWRK